MYRIIQISDLHIPEDSKPRLNIRIREQFELLLENLKKETFDQLVISGDLAYKVGRPDIYEYIKEQLRVIQQPITYMPGNHDNIAMMREAFSIRSIDQNFIFFSEFADYDEILYLDTSAGSLSDSQITWLKQKMDEIAQRLIIICHYPILYSSVIYMDNNHFLRNRTDIQTLLETYNGQVHIFCGHYHSHSITSEKNITQYLCPSNYYTIAADSPVFQIEKVQTGYRTIDISKNQITSQIKFFSLS